MTGRIFALPIYESIIIIIIIIIGLSIYLSIYLDWGCVSQLQKKSREMNSLSATGFLLKYPLTHHTKRRRACSRTPVVFSTLKPSPPPGNCSFDYLICFSEISFLKVKPFSFFISPSLSLSLFIFEVNEFAGDDVLQDFLKERELSGDFVTKFSDGVWLKGAIGNSKKIQDFEEDNGNAPELSEEVSNYSSPSL